ncbi:MAG TPA: hypothetical protein VFY57_08515 [Rubrobacteraceae bacterium]|nr:hypothetical protein [Rubrobacteraceae bacterium]
MVEEIIGRLPKLTGSQLGRLEEEIRRERQRRALSAGGGQELRRYIRRDGSSRERGPYWYFQFHEGGKRRKLYLGKTSDPEGTLAAKRSKPSGE